MWTLATLPRVRNAPSCTKRFLAADLGIALTGILLTTLADNHERIAAGGPTLRRTVVGDPVFTPGLAGLVLGEYRRLAAEPAPPPAPASRTHPG